MKKREIQRIAIVFLMIVSIVTCVFRLNYLVRLERNEETYLQLRDAMLETNANLSTIITEVEEEESSSASISGRQPEGVEEKDVSKHSSFEVVRETNPDIYAWITIEDTKVNYPILQNEEDNYYLKRCIDGRSGLPGCIYTNSCSAKDFSSWNTVVYGHNMKNGTMLGGLKISDDWEEKQEYIDITTSDGKIRYHVYAVTTFSDVYLPSTYDENSDAAREQFLHDVKTVAMESGYLRNNMEVTIDDKLVTLSTCIRGKDDKRLLIIGVLEE